MRPIPLLACALLLTVTAGAQTPAPPKPARAARPPAALAPAPAPRPGLFGQNSWMFEVPATPLPPFEWEMPLMPPLPAFEWEMPLMQLPAFEFEMPMAPLAGFHFELPHLPDFHLEAPEVPLMPDFHFEPSFGQHQWTPMPAPSAQGLGQGVQLATPSALLPGMGWGGRDEPKGELLKLRPEQGSPEDSLYRSAREALNRGEYTRASSLFQSLEQRYPRSRVAPAALYYRAFALYRSGATAELRSALEALKAQQQRYPEAASDPDAAALRTRLYAALAARGDAEAATALRAASAGGPSCDKEDVEVRAEALNALAHINPPEARPTLKKVLARRDECSVRLRRSAVYILGRSGTDEAAADLLEVARTDPDLSVKSDAIVLLGRSPGAATVRTLETIFNESTDDRTRQAALSALRSKGGPEATRVLRTIIERSDVSERMRAEAVSQLGSGAVSWAESAKSGQSTTVGGNTRRTVSEDNEDAAYLRTLYGKTTSSQLKSSILSALARMGGTTNDQFILAVVKNREEDTRVRREALSRLRVSSLSIEELGRLFEALPERDLRSAVVNQLASREEPAALDKLIEIIKSGTDPQIRREAISALARRKDPRATKLLLELVEKP
jgi:HEAT repeat protein